MLDEHSLVVTYNDWRGEPRAHEKQRRHSPQVRFGDCIDCNLCVAVCPQGIDIRNGQQLECITCALCIDACNSVMDKTGRPRGLISYATLSDYAASAAGTVRHTTWRSFIRPRTFLYAGAWALVGLVMLGMLVTRERLALSVLHDRNPIYVRLSDGEIRNGYTVKILNMRPEPRTFSLSLGGIESARMFLAGSEDEPARSLDIEVEPDKLRTVKVYVKADPRELRSTRSDLTFSVGEKGGSESATYKAVFEAPEK
jgi:cytochrome c oxidase accessory protein FixG